MATKELMVKISAQDDASRAFKQVATAATALSKALEEAGSEGDAGFQRVGQGAEKASQAMLKVDSAGTGAVRSIEQVGQASNTAADGLIQIGVGLQSASDAMGDWSQSARDQQQTIIGLKSAFGEFGDDMVQFSDQMAKTTIFNDDDILAGERYFATLKNNYDLSMGQIKDLMQTTADLASAAGISFEDASSRVTSAIRGEGEAAEYLGLTMNQQSIDRQNLTLTMSNQEAAQFRLNALNEQAAAYQGNAAKVAESSVGTYAAVTNTIQDMTQAVGGAVGPWASLVSGLGRGVSMFGEAVRGVGEIKSGLSGLVSAARNSERLMTALTMVTSPLGLAVGGVALALGALGGMWLNQQQGAEATRKAWQEAAKGAKDLDNQILQLYASGDTAAADWATRTNKTAQDWFTAFKTEVESAAEGEGPGWFNDLVTDSVIAAGDNPNSPAFTAMRQQIYDQLAPTPEEKMAFDQALGSLFDLTTNPYVDQDALRTGTESILGTIAEGMKNGSIKSFEDIIPILDEFRASMVKTAGDTKQAMDDMNFSFKLDDMRLQGLDAAVNDLQQFKQLLDDAKATSDNFVANPIRSMGGADDHGAYTGLITNLKLTADEQTRVAAAQERINQVMASGKVDNDALIAAVMNLVQQYQMGEISATEFTDGMVNLASNTDKFATAALAAADAQMQLNDAMVNMYGQDTTAKTTAEIAKQNEALKQTALLREQMAATPGAERDLVIQRQRLDLFHQQLATQKEIDAAWAAGDYVLYNDLLTRRIAQQQMLLDLQRQLNKAMADEARQRSGADNANAKAAEAEERRIKALGIYNQQVSAQETATRLTEDQAAGEERLQALAEGTTAAIERQRDAYRGMFDSFAGFDGLDTRTMAYGMTTFADEAARAGIGMQSVQSSLETTFRLVVDNTNGVSDLADKTLKWADELIGAEGTEGKIDDLLTRELITKEQHKAAQEAYNSIAADTAKIHDDTLQIQAKQAPLIAQQTDALEKQYGIIANMEGATQLAALGWMDSAESAKALEINAMAADVAAGKMGASGKAGFEQMLQSAVLLDPALGAMLEQMNLIDLAADGTTILKINYDQAAGAESEIAKLTDAINALTLAMGGIPPFDVDSLSLMTAEQRAKALKAQLDELRRSGKFDDMRAQLEAVFGDGSGSSPLESASETAKKLNQALTDLAQGKTVGVDASGVSGALQSVADHFRDLDGMTATPKVDADTSGAESDLSNIRSLLEPFDGKTFESRVRVLLDDQTGGDGGGLDSRLGRFGGGADYGAVHIPTVLDAPTEEPDYSALGPAHIPVQLDFDGGKYDAQGPGGGLPDFGGDAVTIKVEADVADAVIGLYNVQMQADTLAASSPTLKILGDASFAIAAVNNVNERTVDDKHMAIWGDASLALAAIDNVNLATVEDKTMTINVVTAYSTTGSPPKATRHGGVLGYAHGGVLFEAGEAGPEIAHFAGGGMAVLPTHDYYVAPAGTRIEPANSAASKLGGSPSVVININAPVFGLDDLKADIGVAVAQAWMAEQQRYRREQGVAA